MWRIGRTAKKAWRKIFRAPNNTLSAANAIGCRMALPSDSSHIDNLGLDNAPKRYGSLEEYVHDPQLLNELVATYWRKHNSVMAMDGKEGTRWVVPSYDMVVGQNLYCTGAVGIAEVNTFFELADRVYGLRDKGDFCDVGANVGTTSIVAARRESVAKVFSFEPCGDNFSCLQANVALNHLANSIIPVNMAVSNVVGHAILGLSPTNSGDHRVLPKGVGYNNDGPGSEQSGRRKTEQVDVCSLDAYFAEKTHNLRYLWIDTQGFEYFVLSGAKQLLASKGNIAIQIEFWPFGSRETDSLEKLCELVATNFSGYIDIGEYCEKKHIVEHPAGEVYSLAQRLDDNYDAFNRPEQYTFTDLFLLP